MKTSGPASVLRVLLLIAFCGIWAAVLSGNAQAEPKERDEYFAYYADGKRYGSQHVTVKKLPDGNFSYTSEGRMLMDFLGVQKQEIKERRQLVISPDYTPISIETETVSMAGKLQAVGRVEQGKLNIELKRDSFKTIRTVDLSKPVILFTCLPDWLNEADIKNRSGVQKFRVVDTDSFSVQEVSAEAKKAGNGSVVWAVNLGPVLGQGEMAFAADGDLHSVDMRIPPVHYERCSETESHDIQHRVFSGREVLSFPLTKPIPRPDRLTSLTVTLEWSKPARDKLNLEDERQHIVDSSQKDGLNHVVIKIQSIKPVDKSLKYTIAGDTIAGDPIAGDEFAPYLAETQFIKPADESIRCKAREWTASSGTALEAVKSLSKEIGKYMQGGTLIVETLSGPEVLQSKQGKCSEHATLFASLARSLGIPARIVLGLRIVGDRWIGHMWNEAYVGRWITVDTTVDEVGDSLQLVKLVHSDSVYGTFPVRWELPKSLEVAIDDFQSVPGDVENGSKTGIAGRVYTNVDYACRLTAPGDDWSIEDKTKSGPIVIRFKAPDEKVLIHFVAFPLPEIIDPTVLINARKQRFQSLYKEFKILKDESYKSGPVTGRIFIFERAANDKESGVMKTTELIWRNGGSCYLFNIIAEKAAHDAYLPKFNEILNSFETIEKK